MDGGESAMNAGVGAHVWFDSSVRAEVRESSFHDTWGPNAAPPTSGSTCWGFYREELPEALRVKLETLVLVPLKSECTADGFRYDELTVVDADGSEARYRDTGCDYLKVDGALAMLPPYAFDGALPVDNEMPCPP